ncbi:MAG: hypothetical protein U0Q21_04610 [Dermatophilaceae bacterium]
MNMTYLASVATYLTIVLSVAATLLGLAVLALGADFAARNHAVRVRRHESIPAYYRHLALGH